MKTVQPPSPAAAPRRPRGRPRSFDRDQALDKAMDVFWSKGFEGASLADLTNAMGINPPSLYAAFGDKEGLFIEAVKRYYQNVTDQCSQCPAATARDAMEGFLTELAKVFTDTSHPRGCLGVMAMTTSLAGSPKMQSFLVEKRNNAKAMLRARIQQGVADGELAEDTDTAALANFFSAVINGMSLQARDGASRKSLVAMVETAMRAWPEAPRRKAKLRVASAAD